MANKATGPHIWVQGEPRKLDSLFNSELIPTSEGKHLDKCRKLMANYDSETAEDWREGIDTQLVVSSLLSAVTTGFIIEAQKNLKEDPANTAVVILGKILQHLNQTAELDTEIESFTSATTIDKLINAFWFTSLAFSLATVTIGLLCLQWIQEYKKDGDHLSQEQYFNFRYARERGFKHWKAKAVIASLPLLLIFSLITFFGGLLVFLGTTNWAVAIPVYVILLITVVFLIITTLIPGIIAVRKAQLAHKNGINENFRYGDDLLNPPFRSLQSWLALKMCLGIASLLYGLKPIKTLRQYQDWVRIDVQWAKWSTDLCRMSVQPLLNLFSDSTEKNTAAICRTLDEFTLNMSRQEEKERDANRSLVYQLQAFPLVVNLSIQDENSGESTADSRLQWTDYLVERYTGTVASWSELPDRKKEGGFWERLDHAFWQFQNTLAGIPAGKGNFNLLTQLLSRHLQDYRVIGEHRNRATIFWVTLGLVLAHPSLQPQCVEKVVSDSLGAIKRIDEEHEVIPGRKMDMVIGVIHGLTDKLEKVAPRARHVLYCIAQDREFWSQIRDSKDMKELVTAVQAEEVVRFGYRPLDEWEISAEGQHPSSPPAQALPNPPLSAVVQPVAIVTDVQVTEPSKIAAPTPPQDMHPLEVSVVVDWASSMTHTSPTDNGVRHMVNTDGAGRSSFSVTLPISPTYHPHPPRPTVPASIQTRLQPGRQRSSLLRQSIHADSSPSSPAQIDSGIELPGKPWSFGQYSPQTSPEQGYFPLRTKTSQVTVAGAEVQALLPTPADTPGE